MTRYCVIGAGAAGLSALRDLLAAGHEVECFERSQRVGGHWHTDYDALHLITARDQTCFRGFPMPADYPHFPRRDEVRRYIEAFADEHGLRDRITFGASVDAVEPVAAGDEPVGSAGWRVRTSRGDEGVFDGVVVANGHLWDKRVPVVPGSFDGVQLHSSEYRNVRDLGVDPGAGRVLVVGAGNSGSDIAADIAQHRYDVDVVMRRGLHFQPKTYFGVPRQLVPLLADFTPSEQDLVARLLARVSIGDHTNYPGMPAPEGRSLAEGATTVNDLMLYWIHHGRIAVRPAVDRFEGSTVHFADGGSGEYAAVVYATGFNVSLAFLDDDLLVRQQGVPVRRAGGILPVGAENLYFVGLIAPRGPQIPVYGTQMELVTRMISLKERGVPAAQDLAAYFAGLQEPETRIDVVRAGWEVQVADTRRLLDALEATHQAEAVRPHPVGVA